MFTGIVQSQAEVYSVKNENNLSHLILKVDLKYVQALTLGASIAINGVCLTVVQVELLETFAKVSFDIIDETLAISNLSLLEKTSVVNFERSLKIGDEIGGHLVSGHVHCTAELVNRIDSQTNCCMRFATPNKWYKYILPKGFITLNGISLTLGEVTDDYFSVHLIPETLSRTNLVGLDENAKVNVEFDQQTITIVDTIERMKLKI